MSDQQNRYKKMKDAEKAMDMSVHAVLDAAKIWADNPCEANAQDLKEAVKEWEGASNNMLNSQMEWAEGASQ